MACSVELLLQNPYWWSDSIFLVST
jgi:hypothetical protein